MGFVQPLLEFNGKFKKTSELEKKNEYNFGSLDKLNFNVLVNFGESQK